jgi:hypothetical protein
MNKNLSLYILIIAASLFLSCKLKTKEVSTKIHNEIESKEILEKDSDDTITLNTKDIFLIKVLSLLPDSSMGKGHKWLEKERKEEYSNALKGFLVNEGEIRYHHKKIIQNNHLFVSVVDSYWQLKIYDLNSSDKIVLTHSHSGDGDSFFIYKFDGVNFLSVNDFFPSDYLDIFFKKPFKRIDYEKYADVDFELLCDFEVINDQIIVSNYYAKDDPKYFNGNTQILNFEKESGKLKTEKIYWNKIK